MKIVKSSKKIQENMLNIILLLGGVILIVALYYYSSNKSALKDNMDNKAQSSSSSNSVQPSAQSGGMLQGVNNDSLTGASLNASSGSVNVKNVKEVVNPADLLPADSNNEWSNMNPPRDDLKGMNFLAPEQHIGINTVGNSLRNANLQLRSEPANPQVPVGPFLNTTIEPDNMRKTLEIGSGAM